MPPCHTCHQLLGLLVNTQLSFARPRRTTVGGGFRGWLLYKCPWQQIWSSLSEPYLLLFPFALSGKTHLIRWRLPIVLFFFLLPPTLAKATLSDLEDLLANWLELLDWKKEPVWGLFIGWSRFLLAEVSSDKKKTTLPFRCQCVGTAQPRLQIFMQSSPPPPTSSFSVRVTPPQDLQQAARGEEEKGGGEKEGRIADQQTAGGGL